MRKLFMLLLLFVSIKSFAQWPTSTSTVHPTDISYGCAVLPNNIIFVTGVEGDINQNFRSSIYKSTNSGVSFSVVKEIVGTSCERIRFWNNNLGIAINNATLYSSFFRTINGGTSWSEDTLHLPSGSNGVVRDICFLDSAILFIASKNKIFKSINFNTTPVQINAPANIGNIDEIHFLTSNLGFCSSGKLFKTNNGGQSWVSITSNINGALNLEGVNFFDADNGIVLYSDGTIYKTTNGGQNWTKVRTGHGASTPYFYQMHFINPLVGYVIGQQEIIATTNGGQTWSSLNTYGSNFSLQNIFVNKNGTGIGTGLTFGNYTYTTNFGGLTTNTTVPTATISGFDSVCNNSTGSIRFDFTGSGPWSVTYSDGATNSTLNNITTSPYFVAVTVTGNKTYTITAFSNNGFASSNIFGKAYSKAVVSNQTAVISGNKSICTGDSAQITIKFTGTKPITFTYSNGITPVTVSNYTDSMYKFYVKPAITTNYTLTSIQDTCNNSGTISGSAVVTIIASIIPPTNFNTLDSNKKVLITWIDNATNEDSIIIERSIDSSGNFIRIKSLPRNSIQYLDTLVNYGQWYYYRLKYIINNTSCVTYSEIDSVFTSLPPFVFKPIVLRDYGTKGYRNASWFDVNNDNKLDIIFGNMMIYTNEGNDVFKYRYRNTNIVLDSIDGSTLKVADIDNDGKTEYMLFNIKENNKKKYLYVTDNANYSFSNHATPLTSYDTSLSNRVLEFINYDNNTTLDMLYNYTIPATAPSFIKQFGTKLFLNDFSSTIYGRDSTYSKTAFFTELTNDSLLDLFAYGDVAVTSNQMRLSKHPIAGQTIQKYSLSSPALPFYSHLIQYDQQLNSNTTIIATDIDNDNRKDFIEICYPTANGSNQGRFSTYTPITNTVSWNGSSSYGDFKLNTQYSRNIGVEDFNNDGWVDIFIDYMTNKSPIILMNNKDYTFTKYDLGTMPPNIIKGYAVALADYNEDGKVDVFAPPLLLKNELPFNNNWINIKCIGTASNKTPFGTIVKIKATINGQTFWQKREITSYGSVFTQNSSIPHFGLGNAVIIDSIIIYWPNGLRSGYQNVQPNQNITYYEPTTAILKVTSPSQTITEIKLNWNAVTNANSYLLERRKIGVSNYITIYSGASLNFEDTSLLPNTAYQYKISTVIGSNTLKDSIILYTKKVDLSVFSNANLTSNLSWQPTKSRTVIFRFFRNSNAGAYSFLKNIQGINNNTTDSLLAQNTSYCYFIQAFYASDSANKSNSDTACITTSTIKVNAGRDTVICAGQSVILTASGASSYVWSNGANTASTTVTPTTTTSYIVTGTINSITTKDTVIVNVNPKPTVSAGIDQNICAENLTTITATGATSYSWNTGQSTASFSVSPTTTTTYIVTGTSLNCSAKDTVKINVNPKPTVSAGLDQSICTGDAATITATGATSYSWNTGQSTATFLVSPTTTTTYIVNGTSLNCSSKDTVIVTVKPLPNVNFSKVVNGANVQFTGPAGNTSYYWNFGDTTTHSTIQSPSHVYTSNGKKYITLTATLNGCSAQKLDSVVISITAILNNISFVNHINIYPNPTDNFITIQLNAKKSALFNISLISIDGKIVVNKDYKNTSIINDEIDLRNYSSGVYLLIISSENEQATYQIIRQ